jgi:hypothetical protein
MDNYGILGSRGIYLDYQRGKAYTLIIIIDVIQNLSHTTVIRS